MLADGRIKQELIGLRRVLRDKHERAVLRGDPKPAPPGHAMIGGRTRIGIDPALTVQDLLQGGKVDILHLLHARHGLECIVDAGELEVAQLGAAQGGNRLRRLPRSQVELGRSAAGRGFVAVDLGRLTIADHGLGIELELLLLAGHGMVETAGGRNRHGQVGFSAEQGTIS